MKNCVKCGIHIHDKRSRCDKCMELVNAELKGETNRPFEFYFKHHLKRQRALDKKIDKILNE